MEDLHVAVDINTQVDVVDVDSAAFNMGFKQRHSPSLVNLFSNRDGNYLIAFTCLSFPWCYVMKSEHSGSKASGRLRFGDLC